MKKLKIFLLLGILLCFGFALSSEVHAQDDGPKIFEIDDIIPANTIVRISWTNSITKSTFSPDGTYRIRGTYNSENYFVIYITRGSSGISRFYINMVNTGTFDIINSAIGGYNNFISPYTQYGGDHAYCDILIGVPIIISQVDDKMDIFTWELLGDPILQGYSITFEENGGTSVTDLSGQIVLPNPLPIPSKENHTFLGWYYDSGLTIRAFPGDPLSGDIVLYAKWGSGKVFEVADVLPQGIIRVSWDETTWYKMPELFGQPDGGSQIKSSNNSFNFVEKIGTNYYVGGIPVLFIPEPGQLEFYPPYTVYGEGHAYVDINTAGWDLAKRTISTVYWSDLITSRLYWEDITPDGYTQGYQAAKEYYGWEDDGHWYTGEDAWDMGNEHAREIYGYYDPITNQWLSVSEYLELYGTDKPGQSDFYNNFDKYFIPAMIIVFGGTIVLTILKVFKGRE